MSRSMDLEASKSGTSVDEKTLDEQLALVTSIGDDLGKPHDSDSGANADKPLIERAFVTMRSDGRASVAGDAGLANVGTFEALEMGDEQAPTTPRAPSNGWYRKIRAVVVLSTLLILWSYWIYRWYKQPKSSWPNYADLAMSVDFKLWYGVLLVVLCASTLAYFSPSPWAPLLVTVFVCALGPIMLAMLTALAAYGVGSVAFQPPRCSDDTPVYVFLYRTGAGYAEVFQSYDPGQPATIVFSLDNSKSNATSSAQTMTLSLATGNSSESVKVVYDLTAGTAVLPSLNLTATFPPGDDAITPVYFPELDTTLETSDVFSFNMTVTAVGAAGLEVEILSMNGYAPGDCTLLSGCIAYVEGQAAAKMLVPLGLIMHSHALDTFFC